MSFSSIPINVEHAREKRQVALHSMLAATAMTILKLGAGLISGSLGVLSEAAHSGLDLTGSGLTFLSVSISDKPADDEHPYGHGKFENLSAFGEAGLMGVSSVWIIYEAIQRILHGSAHLELSIWPIPVLLTSIAVDLWRSRRLATVARKTQSAALAADAIHFASDIWSTLAVLLGLCTSWVGVLFNIPSLRYADPIAAMVVSLMILRLAINMTRDTLGVLTDQVHPETRQRILREVENMPDVLAVEQARVRRSGAAHFADLTLALPRNFTFERTSALVDEARLAVQRVLPGTDVVIHTIPRQASTESIFDRVRAVAARNNVSVHELSVQSHRGRLRVEQHVELNEQLSLREAHNFVCRMEEQILRDAPEVDAILTHIESEPATIEQPVDLDEERRRVEQAVLAAAQQLPDVIDVHEILAGRSGEHMQVSCHCTLPDDLLMSKVHQIITSLEDRIKIECPEVYRVMIHPEPETDNLR